MIVARVAVMVVAKEVGVMAGLGVVRCLVRIFRLLGVGLDDEGDQEGMRG